MIRALNIKARLPGLILAQLLCRTHLIEGDEPLDDLAAVFEVAVGDFVDALDDFGEERVQAVFAVQVQFECVEEGDEVFGCGGDEGAGRGGAGGGVVGGGGVREGEGRGEAGAETFGGAGAVDLRGWRGGGLVGCWSGW